jgi:hypothetical protein
MDLKMLVAIGALIIVIAVYFLVRLILKKMMTPVKDLMIAEREILDTLSFYGETYANSKGDEFNKLRDQLRSELTRLSSRLSQARQGIKNYRYLEILGKVPQRSDLSKIDAELSSISSRVYRGEYPDLLGSVDYIRRYSGLD